MRNHATDAADSFASKQTDNKIEFRCAFEKQSNNQHDCQRKECMQVEQWHRCVNRKLNPPGQETLAVARLGQRGGLLGSIAANRIAGVSDPSYSLLAEEFCAPMPKQHQPCRDCVKPPPLCNEHR